MHAYQTLNRAPEMTFTLEVQESSMDLNGNVKANHEKLTLVLFVFLFFKLSPSGF